MRNIQTLMKKVNAIYSPHHDCSMLPNDSFIIIVILYNLFVFYPIPINDAKEKLQSATESIEAGHYADGIYYAYATYVVGAKAILLSEDIACNTHRKIITDFQTEIVDSGKINLGYNYEERALSINKQKPTEDFARQQLSEASRFLKLIVEYRDRQQSVQGVDKEVVASYYKA